MKLTSPFWCGHRALCWSSIALVDSTAAMAMQIGIRNHKLEIDCHSWRSSFIESGESIFSISIRSMVWNHHYHCHGIIPIQTAARKEWAISRWCECFNSSPRDVTVMWFLADARLNSSTVWAAIHMIVGTQRFSRIELHENLSQGWVVIAEILVVGN